MRIVCPSCAATYDVPDDRLLPGRSVRCAACGAGWTPRPSLPAMAEYAEPEAESPHAVAPEIVDGSSLPAPSPLEPSLPEPQVAEPQAAVQPPVAANPRVGPAILAAWIVSVLIVGGAAWAGVAQRDSVMHAWPPTERLYAVLGLLRR